MPLISMFPCSAGGGEIKFQIGTISASSHETISVSGLSFTPAVVVVLRTSTWGGTGVTAMYAGPDGGYSIEDGYDAERKALASYDLHQGGFTLSTDGDYIVTSGDYAYTAYYID